MISTTWTHAPADLLGMGGLDVRPAYGPALCSGSADLATSRIAAPEAPAQRTGLPAAGTAVRIRPVTRRPIGDVVVSKRFVDDNGTTLGIQSSRRPQS